jgi:glyoxylase-like metal-dependent hydrolase (beta-lactamase superfamily II)
MRRCIRATVVIGLVSGQSLAAQNFDTIQIRTQPLDGGLYMLQGAGGNIGLAVGDDAVFVVDDQFAPLTPKILAAIAAVTPRPVRFVVNTHWHFDHTGGNENMGKAGGLLVAHENVRRRMSMGQLMWTLNRRESAAAPGALPVVTFTESMTFHINGDSVVVKHVPPAHTDGDAIVFFTRVNVIHMGDLFVSEGLPFVDLSSGGSIHGVIRAAETAIAMANAQTRIIPGHGRLADRARLQAYRDMIVALRDRILAAIAAGKTLEEVQADSLTVPYRGDFPNGHDRFVRLAYQELLVRQAP